MHNPRQFHTRATPRTFFDRKIVQYGYGRTIALGKVLPKDWQYVRVTINNKDDCTITLTLTKLKVSETHAQNSKDDKTGGKNT